MQNELKRKTELVLCALLSSARPRIVFYPSRGGGDAADQTTPEPPFCIVSIEEAEKTMATERTWQMTGMLTYVTHMDATTSPSHSAEVADLYNALNDLVGTSGYDVDRQLAVHGIDIGTTQEFSDSDRQAQGDVIEFAIGCSER